MSLLADAGLTLKIKTALIADEGLAGASINVDTVEGTTFLRGSVPSRELRELAEGIAVRNGAHRVVNELAVADPSREPPPTLIPEGFPGVDTPAGAPPSERAAAEEAVRAALAADTRVNEHLVRVHVENGTAYLTGRQDTVGARDAATEAAARVPGIVAVQNDLAVMPSV
jgi:osmotically-inducible protein OsmY